MYYDIYIVSSMVLSLLRALGYVYIYVIIYIYIVSSMVLSLIRALGSSSSMQEQLVSKLRHFRGSLPAK